jgi:hypothetical protein
MTALGIRPASDFFGDCISKSKLARFASRFSAIVILEAMESCPAEASIVPYITPFTRRALFGFLRTFQFSCPGFPVNRK